MPRTTLHLLAILLVTALTTCDVPHGLERATPDAVLPGDVRSDGAVVPIVEVATEPAGGEDAVVDSAGPDVAEVVTAEADAMSPDDSVAAGEEGDSAALPDVPPASGLIVHEWGTFTSVQGSDGVSLAGLHHEDEALPPWVYRRNWSDPYNYYFEKLPEEPLQQLETPVLYFYSAERQAVQVSVTFPEGIVGQWYPDAINFAPPIEGIAAIAAGAMSWDVTLDPDIDPATFLPVSPDEIWAPSRRVASTPVESIGEYGSVERERFIFYRGLGMFDPPVRVTSGADGTLHVTNGSVDALQAVFVLRSSPQAGAIVAAGPLAEGATLELAAPEATSEFPAFVADARALLVTALAETGLYDDEAEAMVDTWTRSWFGNEGLRVLYVAPRAWADTLLPLQVTPAPVEVVRTLVGRIEVVTPAEEQALTTALAAGKAVTPQGLGRFAEPRLRRAFTQLTDPEVKASCEVLLEQAHALP